MQSLRWGIIGFGEAGSSIARHISKSIREPVRVTDPLFNGAPLADFMRDRLAEVSLRVVPDIPALVKECDIVMSLVTPRAARTVGAQAGKVRNHGLFIDFNSISPTEKRQLSRLFVSKAYVDGAILGSISGEGATTNLALAGSHAKRASALLQAVGLRVRVTGAQVGTASALKMCRSIFMKGMECLWVETLLASEEFKITEEVLRSIDQTLNAYGLRRMVNMLVTTHAAHCRRRAGEMESVAKMMTQIGMPARMCRAAREFLAASHRSGLTDHFKGVVPDDVDAVIHYLRRSHGGKR